MLKSEYKKITFGNNSEKDFLKIVNEFKKDIRLGKSVLREWLLNVFLPDLIKWLFKNKYYSTVVEVFEIDLYLHEYFLECLFEIAFSYWELWDDIKSKKYYLECIDNYWGSTAVYNNLAIILEKELKFDDALAFLSLCIEEDDENDLYKKNLARIENNKKDYFSALKNFEKENSFIYNKLFQFMSNQDSNWNIICPHRLIPKFIWLTQYKADEVFTNFIDKKYVIKLDKKSDIWANIYMVNPYIKEYLEKFKIQSKIDDDLLKKSQKLDKNYFVELWYTQELEEKLLNKIYHNDIKNILKRDLYELIICISLWLNKVSLILWWSLIEAILVDLLLKNWITQIKLNWKNKKVEILDLSDLLEESYNNHFISNNLYHLAHWVRWFRNLVHPWAEYRKEELEVSKDNVDIVWTILKKLINELK